MQINEKEEATNQVNWMATPMQYCQPNNNILLCRKNCT